MTYAAELSKDQVVSPCDLTLQQASYIYAHAHNASADFY